MRIVQVGAGTVGAAVVRRFLSVREHWCDVHHVDTGYAGLLDSRGGVLNPNCISDSRLQKLLLRKADGRSLAEAEGGIRARPIEALERLGSLGDVVLVDCAVGEETYDAVLAVLASGGSAVLSNKAPLAVSQDRYDELQAAGRSGALRYEATVGAGLPVISTLHSLLDTGDEVLEIQACASGTLGYITSELMAGKPYSAAVRQARALGYTEPDPRDDLSGVDVARKALILARTCGRRLELDEVHIEPLLPALDPSLSVEEFLEALPEGDREFAERAERARASGNVLKYVTTIPADGEVSVALEEAPAASRIGSLEGADNIFLFRTRQYLDHPLAIIGPGAGPENTAMGVLSDLLQVAR